MQLSLDDLANALERQHKLASGNPACDGCGRRTDWIPAAGTFRCHACNAWQHDAEEGL